MEKRLVIAVALSILIIVGFQFFGKGPAPDKVCVPPCPATAVQSPPEGAVSQKIEDAIPEKQLSETVKVVDNERYLCDFSDIGGGIKLISLKKFATAGSQDPYVLAKIAAQTEYIGRMALLGDGTGDDRYIAEVGEAGVTYKKNNGKLEITKKYTFLKDKYGIGLSIKIKNISSTAQNADYSIFLGSGLLETNKQDERLLEVTAKVDGKVFGFKQPKDAKIIHQGSVDWIADKNKYFSIVAKPFSKTKGAFYRNSRDGYLVNGVDGGVSVLKPGEVVEEKFLIYAGPSDIVQLKEVGYGLEETVNYGFFGGISKFIIAVMKFFYGIVHSWGIAIILLSVFLNLLTFPLTMKSFKSMQKMQELHPQMEKLKVQYKGNPQKLNQEIMELYKKYKINPFSGCLPMLLQMPIFFALYQALMKSIELRCTKFLWIKDLSMPDAVPIPITLPIFGNSINILPLIMVAAMVFQQKMSTATMGSAVSNEQKEQQKIMLIVMPIMFGFIFYNMPSGLVLYWVVNTTLTVIEQAAILKKNA